MSTENISTKPGRLETSRVKLEMIPVESSNVQAIGYSPGPAGKPGNLYIDYKHKVSPGGAQRYCYAEVPATAWERLLAAESKGESVGGFVAKVIKGTYKFHQVEK